MIGWLLILSVLLVVLVLAFCNPGAAMATLIGAFVGKAMAAGIRKDDG